MSRHLLLLSAVLFFAASVWAVSRAGRKNHLSISLHIAQSRRASIVFGMLASIASALAAMTIFGWVLPHYEPNVLSYALYGLIIIDLFTIALVPHVDSTWRGAVHNIAAWGMVYVIPAVMLTALLWPLSDFARYVTIVLTIVNVILLALALFRREKYRPVFLYFQSAYLAVFFLFLLTITYM